MGFPLPACHSYDSLESTRSLLLSPQRRKQIPLILPRCAQVVNAVSVAMAHLARVSGRSELTAH